jgi:hypothetical protein
MRAILAVYTSGRVAIIELRLSVTWSRPADEFITAYRVKP